MSFEVFLITTMSLRDDSAPGAVLGPASTRPANSQDKLSLMGWNIQDLNNNQFNRSISACLINDQCILIIDYLKWNGRPL